mmetsp:Transcript_28775/g.58817  ORF Transcript_28775/g.58817 Transcript_28775/m.58817 type:complete len:242 (+) Transcript_28775:230-955(+)
MVSAQYCSTTRGGSASTSSATMRTTPSRIMSPWFTRMVLKLHNTCATHACVSALTGSWLRRLASTVMAPTSTIEAREQLRMERFSIASQIRVPIASSSSVDSFMSISTTTSTTGAPGTDAKFTIPVIHALSISRFDCLNISFSTTCAWLSTICTCEVESMVSLPRVRAAFSRTSMMGCMVRSNKTNVEPPAFRSCPRSDSTRVKFSIATDAMYATSSSESRASSSKLLMAEGWPSTAEGSR